MPRIPSHRDLHIGLNQHRAVWSRRLWVALLVVLAACTPARREVDGNIVRSVHFDGNGSSFSGQGDYTLRSQMAQRATKFGLSTWPFMYWVKPQLLDPELLPRDAYRLEIWYAHHGWFDAKVLGWQLHRVRPRLGEHKAGIVDLYGLVDSGEPSLIANMDIAGLDGAPELLAKSVLRNADIKEGDQFSLDGVRGAEAALVNKLQNHAYAYAGATSEVTAKPAEHEVDVLLHAHSGIKTVYGPVTVEGNEQIKTKFIEQNVTFQPGEGYKLLDLRETQRRLFEMSTFSIVNVEPDLSDPTVEEVPITVRVNESKFRTLRLGGGLDYDGFLVQPRVSTIFRHTNLLNQLIKFDATLSGGFAYTFDEQFGGNQIFPTYGFTGKVSYPRLMRQQMAIELQGGVTQDVASGLFPFRRPEADLHLVYRPPTRPKSGGSKREFMARIGPHLEEYRYLLLNRATEQAARSQFGEGFVNPYRLFALDQFVSIDTRDDKVFSTRGWYLSLQLREAIPIDVNGFSYGEVVLDGRRFFRPKFKGDKPFPVVLAAHGNFHVLQPFGESPVPYPELAFLGGPNSLRGFRQGQVGPYDTLCVYTNRGEDTELEHYHLPRGGTVATETSAEIRYDWAYGLKLATFVDAGILASEWNELGLEDFRISSGVGFRYDTVIGPLRFDLSFRRIYPEDIAPNSYINCSEHDHKVARPYDFFSAFKAWRGTTDRPPFAMVFFLAIGESI